MMKKSKKDGLLVLFAAVIAVFALATQAKATVATDGYDYVFLNYQSFSVDNQWSEEYNLGSYTNRVLRAGASGNTASAYVQASANGEYDLWVRTVDFKTSQGSRSFSVQFNTGYLDKSAGSFDLDWDSMESDASVWQWECIGSVYLTEGVVNKITIQAKHGFSRMDCMVLTNNLTYTPPEKSQISALEVYKQDSSVMTYNASLFKGASYALSYSDCATRGTFNIGSGSLSDNDDYKYFFNGFLEGRSDHNTSAVESAFYEPYIHEAGTYVVWARTGTPQESSSKSRNLKLKINGTESGIIGNHADKAGFAWERVGSFHFNAGINTIELIDANAYFGRISCIYITKDGSCQPSNYESAFTENTTYVSLINGFTDTLILPDYIENDSLTTTSVVEISNGTVDVKFYNVSDGTHQFVQNEVSYEGNVLKNRSDAFVRQLYRYGSATKTNSDQTMGSPILNVTNASAMNVAYNDWATDTEFGVPAEKTWTNVGVFDPKTRTTDKVKGETVRVKLNIPKSGYYYGVTRGYAYSKDTKRGYTVSVNGTQMTSESSTHYFNVTNATLEKYAFSYNTDPIYLEAGVVEVVLSSFDGSPMRTSFFALIPADSTTELQTIIDEQLTDYDTAVSFLGGNALDDAQYGSAPVTTTDYPYPITYDYVQKVNEVSFSRRVDDIYKMGTGYWLVPKTAVLTGENQVTLTYGNDYVDVKEIWELKDGDEEPRVTLTYTAKKRGSYYIAIPTHDAFKEEEYEYGLLPMQYRGHQFPAKALLVTEQYMFTPMVTVSLPEDNSIVPGEKITYGYTVEPSWIENRWVYNWDYDFGATMRSSLYSEEACVSPTLISSAPGGRSDEMLIGDSYTFKFRPIYRTGDWFETFSHVTKDLFEVRDYRQNYYHSVTDAILNTTELMMDDFYGGWDDNNMGFWNMEGRGFTSQVAPLEIVQRYLLTDSDEILRERTIPTIVSTMTRATHFKSNTTVGGAQQTYLGTSDNWPTAVGTPSSYYGASVFGGLYEMSQDSFEPAMDLAVEKADSISDSSRKGSDISDLVAMYNYTGDAEYLEKAKKVADNYIDYMESEKTASFHTNFGDFAYIAYMPYISGLIDIYEATKEQKYLDAAEYAGQVILTLVWNVGIDGDRVNEPMLLDKNTIGTNTFMEAHNFWWHGEIQWRPGVDLDENMQPTEAVEVSKSVHPLRQLGFDDIVAETVPSWLPSRAGIGLEQPSTFYSKSLNMIMSNWAGDMMRLAEYTGNDQFATASRNAIIGRFGTYPGYYQDRFVTLQMQENYHKESPVDISSVYWHHIPAFLSMIEDFIVTQAWSWSDRNIEFPSTRQQGYAYFNNRQYGYAAGKFFDQNDMWLWIDDDVVTTSSVNLDWIAARKDGVMGIALMNELSKTQTFEVTLGNKADANYSGKVFLYSPDGSFTTTTAQNGKFSVTIPAKSLVGALIMSDVITAPSFAHIDYAASTEDDVTYVEHTDVTGAGTILQFSPDTYFTHIYITEKDDTASKIEVNYTLGSDTAVYTVSDDVYPFEVILEIGSESVTKPIHYTVTVYNTAGTQTKSKTYTLQPLDCTIDEPTENSGATILLTGKNYQTAMGSALPGNSWDKTNYILGEYGVYREGLSEQPSITVEVPADGEYYIYGNVRAGYNTGEHLRYINISVTQDGKTQTVTDTDGNTYKFGYSADVVKKLSDITENPTGENSYWINGLGVMAPTPISLKKGTATIQVSFGVYGGFDFILLTSDMQVRTALENYRVYPEYNIYKFWRNNDENNTLRNLLLSYIDVTAPQKPIITDLTNAYATTAKIKIDSAGYSDSLYYKIYVDDVCKQTVYVSALEQSGGKVTVTDAVNGSKVYVIAVDEHGNESVVSDTLTVTCGQNVRPTAFANLNSGIDYTSVADAKNADALPNGYFAFITQENLTRENGATKQDTNLFTGNTDNYYANKSDRFLKVFSGHFVIPENAEGEEAKYYQFISSYLRAHHGGTVWVDNRRTHFLLIDGKALTENGLVDWNGETAYDFTSATNTYSTNSYVFGSEYPHEFTTEDSTTKDSDINKNYPHNVVTGTGHLWGYSPAIQLDPGVHTVEVYSVGTNGWFNNLIITSDIGYDITKLLYGGLGTRSTAWKNNFNTVIAPNYTDYTAPSLTSGVQATVVETGETVLKWTAATDAGYGATGANIAYKVEISNASGTKIATVYTSKNTVKVSGLSINEAYTAVITAYDGSGNHTAVSASFTPSTPAVLYTYGAATSTLTLDASVNSDLAGDAVIYVVGYKQAGEIDSISSYPLNVPANQAATVRFTTPVQKDKVTYKLYIWQKNTLKPLYNSITPKAK